MREGLKQQWRRPWPTSVSCETFCVSSAGRSLRRASAAAHRLLCTTNLTPTEQGVRQWYYRQPVAWRTTIWVGISEIDAPGPDVGRRPDGYRRRLIQQPTCRRGCFACLPATRWRGVSLRCGLTFRKAGRPLAVFNRVYTPSHIGRRPAPSTKVKVPGSSDMASDPGE
jgi:hypothetical protein